MILQALSQYYHRKADSGGDIAPQGFEKKQIPFIIVIDKEGNLVHIEDTRGSDKQTKKGSLFLMPLANSRSGKNSFKTTNMLWDHYGYVVAQVKGIDGINKKTEEQIADEIQKNIEMAEAQHQTFKTMVTDLSETLPDDVGISAVKNFLNNSEAIEAVKQSPIWEDCLKIKGCNLTFKLKGEVGLICQSKSVQEVVKHELLNNDSEEKEDKNKEVKGICLIKGEYLPIARLHQPISGVNKKPSPFSSIQLKSAFESYGKTQGFGFPVSQTAMFEYTTALNSLLSSNNRFRLGEVTAVCWSEKATPKESEFSFLFNSAKDNPDEYTESVEKLYSSFNKGTYTEPDATQRMYVLGLSPNVARIVVRFWIESTIADMATNIKQWFDDIQMVRGTHSPYPQYMPLLRLLCNLVFEGKVENLPPNMVADTTKSILNGSPLPVSVLQMAIRRNRAEQSITHARACLIRASLNRKIRYSQLSKSSSTISSTNKEISMSYDPNRTDIGYILGSLFAVLEKIQEDSAGSGKINATIRDRYFGSASSTPITVFATLIKLSQHHLSKISKSNTGRFIWLNKQLSEIMANIDVFPSHLNMEQQGLFALGYYHKRQDFFISKEDKAKAVDDK